MYTYSREELLDLDNNQSHVNNTLNSDGYILVNNNYIRKRKRGKKGGLRNRLKQRGHRTALPSVVLSNVQSLNNKITELHAKTAFISENRNSSVLCFIETWLSDSIPSSAVTPPEFSIVRADRDINLSNKQKGGGLCLFINEKWCTNYFVVSKFCSPKLEYLVVRCKPFYLPREISCVNFVLVYLPEGYDILSVNKLYDVVSDLETDKPDSTIIVLGDFNGVTLKLAGFHQYVDCTTRKDNKIDLLYCNIKDAYKCTKRDPLGISDHHTLVLSPCYRQKLKQHKPTVKCIKSWSEDSEQSLQVCFDCTDWEVFCDSCDTSEELVDVISDYICFCEDIVVPSKTVKIYPNNKPWFSKEIKQKLLSKQHLLSESNNRSLLKTTQDDINKAIEKCKLEFKTKLENQFKSNNTKEAWKGLELVTQYKPGSKSLSDDQENLPDKLNTFYGRFDTTDNTQEIDNVKNTIHSSSDKGTITITNSDVYKHFKSLNPRKSKGPDGVSPKLLRICSQQLSPV